MTTINELDNSNTLTNLEAQVLALGYTLDRVVSVNNLPGSWSLALQPYDASGGYSYKLVNAVKTKVYTKYITGSLNSTTNYTAALLGSIDHTKVLDFTASIMSSTGTTSVRPGAGNASFYQTYVDTDSITMNYLSTVYKNGTYSIRLDYTV